MGGIETTVPGSAVISALPGDSSQIFVGSHTISLGGPGVTVPGGNIVSLASSGVVVKNTGSGSVTTYALPLPPAPVISQPSIGFIGGQTISGIAIGSSQAVVEGQTLTVGGSLVTLPGSQVASLGSSGLVIEAPSGIVTTIAVPTPVAVPLSGISTKGASIANESGAAPTLVPSAVPAGDNSEPNPSGASPSSILSDVPPVIDIPSKTSNSETSTSSSGSESTFSSAVQVHAPSSLATTPIDSGNVEPTGSTTTSINSGNSGPTGSTTSPVTSTGLGGIIYTTFQGDGSRTNCFGSLGSMLGLVFGVLHVLNG